MCLVALLTLRKVCPQQASTRQSAEVFWEVVLGRDALDALHAIVGMYVHVDYERVDISPLLQGLPVFRHSDSVLCHPQVATQTPTHCFQT